MDKIIDFAKTTGFYMLFGNLKENWTSLAMILISLFLLYLGIKKQFEPLLLVGIAFGMLLTNLTAFTGADNAMYHTELWTQFMDESSEFYHSYGYIMSNGGLLDFLYIGVKTCIYPCLIFIGIGAMTDFEPLIASPKSLLLGAAAQVGIFVTFIGCLALAFPAEAAASIGIIGGADGPTVVLGGAVVKGTDESCRGVSSSLSFDRNRVPDWHLELYSRPFEGVRIPLI